MLGETASEVVAECDRGTELPLLDRQPVNGEAANTHTHTHKRTRLDQWSGKEIFALWIWSLRDNPNEPAPAPLVPNGRRSR